MKRKLTLSFIDNTIVNVCLAERGKRKQFLPLTSADEAIEQVSELLTIATQAINPSEQEEPEEIDLVAEAELSPTETTQNLAREEIVQSLPYSVCARAKKETEEKSSDD